jgi:adenylyltransferase/sulfurtransferase
MILSDAELDRYARQLLLPGMGVVTQEFLRAARIQVVGGGAVAGPAMLYLAAAGVGTLLLDDAGEVAPEDAAGWLYPPDRAGQPRVTAAIESLKAATRFVRARIHATGADPSAALICGGGALAREGAERARLAGIPHVVADGDGEGGVVIAIPPGAPCYACAFQIGTGVPAPPATAAAVGALAAAELLLLVGGVVQPPQGRRIELVRGHPSVRATTRQAGCACGSRAA